MCTLEAKANEVCFGRVIPSGPVGGGLGTFHGVNGRLTGCDLTVHNVSVGWKSSTGICLDNDLCVPVCVSRTSKEPHALARLRDTTDTLRLIDYYCDDGEDEASDDYDYEERPIWWVVTKQLPPSAPFPSGVGLAKIDAVLVTLNLLHVMWRMALRNVFHVAATDPMNLTCRRGRPLTRPSFAKATDKEDQGPVIVSDGFELALVIEPEKVSDIADRTSRMIARTWKLLVVRLFQNDVPAVFERVLSISYDSFSDAAEALMECADQKVWCVPPPLPDEDKYDDEKRTCSEKNGCNCKRVRTKPYFNFCNEYVSGSSGDENHKHVNAVCVGVFCDDLSPWPPLKKSKNDDDDM